MFYNLDAQAQHEYQFETEEELYQFQDKIGEGAFSVVYKAVFIPTQELIAVKILKEDKGEKATELFIEEAKLLDKLDHPNIIKVKHLIKLNQKLFMGMDYLPGGSLHSYLK